MKLPKHTQKRIFRGQSQDGKTKYATGAILIGYCPDTLEYFNAMYKLARKTFVNLKTSEITCGKVTKSNCIQGFTIILFNIKDAKESYEGWAEWGSIDFNY